MFIDGMEDVIPSDDTIGGRMSLARDACEVTIPEAAEMAGVHEDVWASWENDRAEPIAGHLDTVAAVLDVSLAWLVSGRGIGPDWAIAE